MTEQDDRYLQALVRALPEHTIGTYNSSPPDADGQRLINEVYDELRTHGEWPGVLELEIRLRNAFDIEEVARRTGYRWVGCAPVSQEGGQCRITLDALRYCDGAERDRSTAAAVIATAASRFIADPLNPSWPIAEVYDIDGEARLFAYIGRNTDGTITSLQLSPDLLNYEGVLGLDDYLARRDAAFAKRSMSMSTASQATRINDSEPGDGLLFLSHAAADAELAEYLEMQLKISIPDLDVFRTTRVGQIPAGKPWLAYIQTHLRNATRFLILLTPASIDRPWVLFELGAAWYSGHRVVPILAGGLRANDLKEPIASMQVLSLDNVGEAQQAFREFGGERDSSHEFVAIIKELSRRSAVQARSAANWQSIELSCCRFQGHHI